jgi:pantoate--beta-alanine ligase
LREKSPKLQALRICRQFLELQNLLSGQSDIGFVPTMGALHAGHLSLIQKAATENSLVVVSIFVNPLQFNNQEDLINYPRQEGLDIALLEHSGCNLLFLPSHPNEVFNGSTSEQMWEFGGLDSVMEGASRPGHFKGVAEVVSRFFEIIKPHRAYFGEKDFQQLQVIKKMTQIKQYPVEIVPCPILRESSGLAMSSRNQRLTEQGKNKAALLYQILKMVCIEKEGSKMEEIRQRASKLLKEQNIELDYLVLAEEEKLGPQESIQHKNQLRVFIAATIEGIRLIDNMPLD